MDCSGSILLSIQEVRLNVSSNLLLPLVPIEKQLLLIVQQLLVGLCGKLKIWTLIKGKAISIFH